MDGPLDAGHGEANGEDGGPPAGIPRAERRGKGSTERTSVWGKPSGLGRAWKPLAGPKETARASSEGRNHRDPGRRSGGGGEGVPRDK